MCNVPDPESLVDLRKELHKFPELSGYEEVTSKRISSFLEKLKPDQIMNNIGGYGVAARFKGKIPGPRVMIRAELDALPINESNNTEHRSTVAGVSHACGHDGHMAIAAGVASCFAANRPERGELVVLFQPSEENGKGAFKVLNDVQFNSVTPDYILALHNLPGFARNEIVLRNGVFSMASVGMIAELKGKTSHAAEPENGVSPSKAVARIIMDLPGLPEKCEFIHFALATIIHTRIGEIAFGTSPGDAVVMATLRAYDNAEMDKMVVRAEELVRQIAGSEGLGISVEWTEKFPATVNDRLLNEIAVKKGEEMGLKLNHIKDAFKWSEDFGWFSKKFKGLLFGIGAGTGHPELHNPDYDFPDEISETGICLLASISRELLNYK